MALILVVAGAYFASKSLPKSVSWDPSYESVSSFVDKYGVEEAYKRAKEHLHNEGVTTEGHLYFHTFGQIIYDKKGLEGVYLCDDSFNYGCYHGYFLRAFATEGLAVLPKLQPACGDIYSCHHGIGHGLLELVGRDKLVEALDLCPKVEEGKHLSGCQTGVFMEYNFPDGLRTGNFLPYDENLRFGPCANLPEDYKYNCYYSLPQWWLTAKQDNYRDLGASCIDVEGEQSKTACFRGIGAIGILSANYQAPVLKDLCSQIENEEGVLNCRLAGYGGLFEIGGKYREEAKELCREISAEFEKLCLESR